jgi:hypothetical protein
LLSAWVDEGGGIGYQTAAFFADGQVVKINERTGKITVTQAPI